MKETTTMLRVAVPNKGALSETAAEILSEAGYRRRTDSRDLTVLDPANQVEFFFLRPKDIAIYVGSGELDLGITGRDLAADSMAEVDELLDLGFGHSTFRYAGPAGEGWDVDKLAGARIATSYPGLVDAFLDERGGVAPPDGIAAGRPVRLLRPRAAGRARRAGELCRRRRREPQRIRHRHPLRHAGLDRADQAWDSFFLPNGRTDTIPTTSAPTARPITAEAAVLTSQASTAPTPPTWWTYSSAWCTRE